MDSKEKNISKRNRVMMMIARKEQIMLEVSEKEAKLKARGMTLKPRTKLLPTKAVHEVCKNIKIHMSINMNEA